MRNHVKNKAPRPLYIAVMRLTTLLERATFHARSSVAATKVRWMGDDFIGKHATNRTKPRIRSWCAGPPIELIVVSDARSNCVALNTLEIWH